MTIWADKSKECGLIRERTLKITTWSCGIFLLLTSWVVGKAVPVSIAQRSYIAVGIATLALATVVQIRDHKNGLASVLGVMSTIEAGLKFYQKGAYFEDVSIMPMKWKELGPSPKSGFYFINAQIVVGLTACMTMLALFAK